MSAGPIWLCGDVHGDLRHLQRALAIADELPGALILLGDLDPPQPVGEWLAPLEALGPEVWFIHGNHETDNDTWYRNTFLSPGSERNLDGRVVEIAGVRVAGLGGVFREEAWYPPAAPRFDSYAAMAEHAHACTPKRERGAWPPGFVQDNALPPTGRLRKHRSSIFPDAYHRLASQSADVLVAHEAPLCHPYGFEAIDLLAAMLGVGWAVHGHHHADLDYLSADTSVDHEVIGVGFRQINSLQGFACRIDTGTSNGKFVDGTPGVHRVHR